MGIKIKTIEEAVTNTGIKILVHGLAGSGKTVLGGTTGQKTLYISAEGGLLSLKGAIDSGLLPEKVLELTDVVEVFSIEELMEVYEYALKCDHEWLVLDSISEIGEVVLDYEKKSTKDPRKAYGELITQMSGLLRKFRDIPGKNVLMTCKQQRYVDPDTERTQYVPSMPGSKLHQQIPYMFDEVFALRVEADDEGQEYRVLQTNRDPNYEAKDRSGKLDNFEEPSIFAIMKKIKPKKNEAKKEDAEEDNKLQEIIAEGEKYWEHVSLMQTMKTEKGDDISHLFNDPEVCEITKEEYEAANTENNSESD